MTAWHFGTNTTLFASGTLNQRTLTQVIRNSDNLFGGYVEFASNLSQSGSAFIYGSGSYVLGSSVIEGTSSVSDYTMVYDTSVKDSIVHHFATLIASNTYNSIVGGNSYVTSCSLDSSILSGSNTITNSSLNSSQIFGTKVTLSDSTITNSSLNGACYVLKQSNLTGCYVSGSSSSGSQYTVSYNSRGAPYMNNMSVPMIIGSTLTNVTASSGVYVNQ